MYKLRLAVPLRSLATYPKSRVSYSARIPRRFQSTKATMGLDLKGRCVCSSLKYSVNLNSADDARTTLCHCKSCRRAFGANYGLTTKVRYAPGRSPEIDDRAKLTEARYHSTRSSMTQASRSSTSRTMALSESFATTAEPTSVNMV